METLIHTLNKNSFFYDYITTLAYSQFGINELFSRGFYLQKRNEFPNDLEFIDEIRKFNFPEEVEEEIFRTQTFTPLIFVPGFVSKNEKTVFRLDPNLSALKFIDDTRGITDTNIRLTHMTIISAFEKIMQQNLDDSHVLQFFRHIRNASAHDGKFHFDKKVIDPKNNVLIKKAHWKEFNIQPSLQGKRLIKENKDDKEAFWDQGDFIEFLLDFENYYPKLDGNITVMGKAETHNLWKQ